VNELRQLLREARAYRGRLGVALVAMIVYAAGNGLQAYLIKVIVDGLAALRSGDLLTVTQGPFTFQITLAGIAGLILLAYFLKGVGGYASDFLMTDVGQRVVRDLRNRLFRHILGQSATFFARNTSGQLVSRITNDVNQVQNVVSETVADLARACLTGLANGLRLL
jgi:subfamily B ATP-binding cassette protein MsbA